MACARFDGVISKSRRAGHCREPTSGATSDYSLVRPTGRNFHVVGLPKKNGFRIAGVMGWDKKRLPYHVILQVFCPALSWASRLAIVSGWRNLPGFGHNPYRSDEIEVR